MSIAIPQSFYRQTITRAVTLTGATNIYVSALPTPAEGYITISPASTTLREVVYYTATGTDGNGSYITVTAPNRGLDGTTAQTHIIGEPVRMNVGEGTIQDISDAIDQIVAGGAQDASTVTKGIVKLNIAPTDAAQPIAIGSNTIVTTSSGASDENKIPSLDNTGKFLTAFVPSKTIIRQYDVAGSPHTWTKDSSLKYIRVQIWGAGGSGGRHTGSNGSGGGGGSYREDTFLPDALTSTVAVTIGAGGASVTVDNTPGNNGSNSTFGSYLTAYGGGGNNNPGGGGAGTHSAGSGSVSGNGISLVSIAGFTTGGASGASPGNSIQGGGGGGNAGTNNGIGGGSSYYGGGGGGGAGDSDNNGLGSGGGGGNSHYGGGGGGGKSGSAAGRAGGGTSVFGGAGGNGTGGSGDPGSATAGAVPGGGGGGSRGENSGAGGAGRCIVTEYY